MRLERIVRFIGWLVLGSIGLAFVSQAALGETRHHKVSPRLLIGPKATPVVGAKTPLFTFTCNTVGGTPDFFTCYDVDQMRHAYGIDALIAQGYDGTGRTIVIVDAFQSPTLAVDLAVFNLLMGLPDASLDIVAPDGLTPFDPTSDDQQGWAGEITLDVEWSHAMAPGAHLVLVLAKSDDDADILSAVKYAVDHRLGDIVSMSFGENESCTDPDIVSQYHDVFVAATQKNMTLFASSGDDGAAQMGNPCPPTPDSPFSWVKAVSHPAVDPLVTAVGGTELHATRYCSPDPTDQSCGVPGTYQGEIVWNEPPGLVTDGSIATGGGFSVIFDQPPYQQATIKGNQRAVPDVSYNAAVLHGLITVFQFEDQGCCFLFGGTSAGSPQWSAITAIADQKAGKSLGFLNKAIYQIGRVTKAYPLSFHDVTVGNNSVTEFDSDGNPINIAGFSAGTGWDATTGLGSPISTSIVDNLIQYVSPGDGQSAISTTKPKPHPKPVGGGQVQPH